MKDIVIITPLVAASTYINSTFAQSGTPSMDPGIGNFLGTLFGNLGIMGVLGWYLWHHSSVAQPRMIDKFAESQAKMLDNFSEMMRAEREANKIEREADRLAHSSEQREMRATFERVTEKLTNTLIQTLTAMRTAVHDIKDASQTAITEAAKTELRSRDSHHGETIIPAKK